MHKIVVPFLSFGNEKIKPPVGLSELLESTWTMKDDSNSIRDIANRFSRSVYKKSDGRWVTKFELKAR